MRIAAGSLLRVLENFRVADGSIILYQTGSALIALGHVPGVRSYLNNSDRVQGQALQRRVKRAPIRSRLLIDLGGTGSKEC